jgi:hypothetical protein
MTDQYGLNLLSSRFLGLANRDLAESLDRGSACHEFSTYIGQPKEKRIPALSNFLRKYNMWLESIKNSLYINIVNT